MNSLNADEVTALAEALRLLTAATKQTGHRFDGGSLVLITSTGDYLTARWHGDDADGQYVVALE